MTPLRTAAAGIALCLLSSTLMAQQPIAYPTKGQSQDKQQADEAYCRNWTESRTGITQQMARRR